MWLDALSKGGGAGGHRSQHRRSVLAGLTGWHCRGDDNLLSWTLGDVYRPPPPVSSPCLFRQDSSSPLSSRPPSHSTQQQPLSPLRSAGLFSLPVLGTGATLEHYPAEAGAQLPTTRACL